LVDELWPGIRSKPPAAKGGTDAVRPVVVCEILRLIKVTVGTARACQFVSPRARCKLFRMRKECALQSNRRERDLLGGEQTDDVVLMILALSAAMAAP
jgi:hypothetical protein